MAAITCTSTLRGVSDLHAAITEKAFREDLYYRLSTIPVEVPPLRTRAGDVELLANHCAAMLNERFGSAKRIGGAALEILRRHNWPGNVRELLHAVEAAMVICEGAEVLPEHLPPSLRNSAAAGAPAVNAKPKTLEELERAHIRAVLEASGGHRGNAAKALGISERNLYRKLRDLSLLP